MSLLLENKTALITGAAGGIGRQAAITFAREGARVAVSDISGKALAGVVEEIKAAGGEAIAIVADVTRAKEVRAMVRGVVDAYGRLDCAFNNAGVNGSQVGASGALTAEWSEESFDKLIAVNLKGVWLCMKAEIEQMLAQGGGSIVNTASLTSIVGLEATSIYAASKHGVLGLAQTAALEYAPIIRFNCVCPGFVDTEMLKYTMSRRGPEILAKIPFGRLASTRDVAEMVCWLSSDRASYVTGGAFPVDGGYLAR
jgi:NAD(P)-dependent dehydrogenase (short-subunit alcohol dehydrogenase family)